MLIIYFYEYKSFFDHLLTLCCLALSQCQKPGPYVKEMNDAAMFYTNRVLKDYKDMLVHSFFYLFSSYQVSLC